MKQWSNAFIDMPSRQISHRLAILLLGLAAFVFAGRTQAQMHDGVELVKADLLADTAAVTPGKPFTVGLRLKMAPHWHTYWQYSGDAGLPTKIDWQLPPGFKAGPIQWPVPEKIVSPGDIINYGYDEEVVLLVQISPPAQLPPGDVLLKAKASWLVCADICIPGKQDLMLKLSVGDEAQSAKVEPAKSDLLERYRKRLPIMPGADDRFVFRDGMHLTDIKEPSISYRKEVGSGKSKSITVILEAEDNASTALLRMPGDFFPLPDDALTIGHPGAVTLSSDGKRVSSVVEVVDGPMDTAKLAGLFVFRPEGGGTSPIAFGISYGKPPERSDPAKAGTSANSQGKGTSVFTGEASSKSATPAGSLGYFLLLGFLGGIILNVMPCVLPVISLKLFSFVKQSNEAPEQVLKLGLAYAAGVFAWFLGFAALVVILRSVGREIGYAAQFQNPWFIVGLSAVTFVFALNLLGVFEVVLPGALSNAAGAAAGSRDGLVGAFLQGMLVTILGSACTTWLVGPALGFAFSQSAVVIFAMFAAVAFGMSAPFVLIAANPRWLRFLPKPGTWTERVKQGTGFLLLATVLWLLWVLGQERGADAIIWTGAGLLALGAACWVQGAFNTLVASDRARWISRAVIIVLALGGGWLTVTQVRAAHLPEAADKRPFTEQLAAALKTGRPVFVDFTAAWCVNCKVNEHAVLNSDAVQKALQDRNAALLKADWTNQPDDITKLLRQFGRAGVPLYVLYPAGKPDAPVVMPELLTRQIVLDAFTEADHRAESAAKPVAAR